MISFGFKSVDETVSRFGGFFVKAYRFSSFSSFWLFGSTAVGPKYLCSFDVVDDDYASAFHESLTVCDMLVEFLDYSFHDYSEACALKLIREKYPDHFKYFDKLGYHSPEEGGDT